MKIGLVDILAVSLKDFVVYRILSLRRFCYQYKEEAKFYCEGIIWARRTSRGFREIGSSLD